jgi:phosphatidylinositol-3-phosphatase
MLDKSLRDKSLLCAAALAGTLHFSPATAATWPPGLPVYDHIVIVPEENKDFEEIISKPEAAFINELAAAGASFTNMFGEEHNSEGNYFWLFSGSDQGVCCDDKIPKKKLTADNLAGG